MQKPTLPPPDQHAQERPEGPKKGGSWLKRHPLIAGVAILAILVIGIVSLSQQGNSNKPAQNVSQQQTQINNTPTGHPTQSPKWTTAQTFKGNGSKKTAVFHVANDWRILWSCTPGSFVGGSYNLVAFVYNSDATLADAGVNTICKVGNTSDSTEEHQGGDVYLDITSEGDWVIQVQELK